MEQLGNLAQRFVWHSNTRGSEDPSGSIGHLNVTRLPPHNIMHYPSLCDLEDIGLGRQLKICLWFRCGSCGTNKPPARIVLTSCWFCFSKYPPPPPEIIYKKHMKSICQWCSSVAWCYSEKNVYNIFFGGQYLEQPLSNSRWWWLYNLYKRNPSKSPVLKHQTPTTSKQHRLYGTSWQGRSYHYFRIRESTSHTNFSKASAPVLHLVFFDIFCLWKTSKWKFSEIHDIIYEIIWGSFAVAIIPHLLLSRICCITIISMWMNLCEIWLFLKCSLVNHLSIPEQQDLS